MLVLERWLISTVFRTLGQLDRFKSPLTDHSIIAHTSAKTITASPYIDTISPSIYSTSDNSGVPLALQPQSPPSSETLLHLEAGSVGLRGEGRQPAGRFAGESTVPETAVTELELEAERKYETLSAGLESGEARWS